MTPKQKRMRQKSSRAKVRAKPRRIGKTKKRVSDGVLAKTLTHRMRQQEVASYLSLIALANPHMGHFMAEAVAYLARSLDADFAKIMELSPTRKEFILRAGVGWDRTMKVNKTTFPAQATLSGHTILSKRPIVFSDLRKEKSLHGITHLKRHRVVSGMSVIIPTVAEPYGVLGVYTRKKRIFSDDDVSFLQSVANVIALAHMRNAAESELRRFQYMADNANVGISLIDSEGYFKYANKITYERLGFTKDEYMKKRVRHRTDEKSPPKFDELFRVIQKKTLPPFETYEMKKDGKTRVPLEINLTGVTFEGEPYMFAVTQDITSRKRETERLEFLAQASLALGSSLDYRETLERVADIATEHLADWCSVEMIGASGLELVAISAKKPAHARLVRKLRHDFPLNNGTPVGISHVIATGKPELHATVTEELLKSAAQSPQHLKLLRDIGFKSVMIVPIKISARIIGAFRFVVSESERRYDKSDLAIALELANRAALAIENSRLYVELGTSKERLDKIMTNVPGMVWEMWLKQDPSQGHTNFVSDYVSKMMGYTADEWLVPEFWFSRVHEEDRQRARDERAYMIREGKGMIQRLRWIHRDGQVIWTESHVSPILDAKGKALGLRGVTMDASERMELEKRKDEFISMASHELKTPVTTLKVFTQILQKHSEKAGDPTATVYLSKMESQISRLTDLINDLLDLSRIQTGKLSFKLTSFDPDELVEEIVEQIQPTAERHSIKIKGSIGRKVTGDRDRLGQVIINLLINAIKYSPKAKEVNIRLSNDGRNVSIGVEDFGIGISPSNQKKIFTRFYQVTGGNNKKTFPGLGIGLYISDEIVRRHGGTITVKSSEGKGSMFTITLPIASQREIKSRLDHAESMYHE